MRDHLPELLAAVCITITLGLTSVFMLGQRHSTPRAWDRDVITVRNESRLQATMDAGISIWNEALVPYGMRFELVGAGQPADVIVRTVPDGEGVCGHPCVGRVSLIGAPDAPFPRPTMLTVQDPGTDETVAPHQPRTVTLVHELGHVLGLEHTDDCAIMNSARSCELYSAEDGSFFMCGPMASDIDQLSEIYERDSAAEYPNPWCHSEAPAFEPGFNLRMGPQTS